MAELTPVPRSPEWWVNRLYKALAKRQPELEFYDAYYTGDHPLPWLAPQAREEFRRLVRMTRSNYMGLVCDATAERVSVEGVRLGGADDADADTWRIWQANSMDADSDKAILESLIGGCSYLLVAPNSDDEKTPYMWTEHASQAIVEHLPGSNRRVRAAGLKVWDDDWTGELHATLYLPDRIYKFAADRPKVGMSASLTWAERTVKSEQPNGQRLNPLGVVPLVEIPNNPRLLTGGVSELYDLTDIQDRVNKTLFDRLQTQEFGVDPQKWAKAFPNEDGQGNPNVIAFGRNRMITTDVAETAFGNFAVAPLDPYSNAKREDVKDIASRSRTPAQYLLGEMSNVNGETLKASESGLVSKVRQRRRGYSEGFKDGTVLVRFAAGLPTANLADIEIIYTNPEFRTQGELADSVIKMHAAGLSSTRQSREDYGYTAAQIARLEDDDQSETMNPAVQQILGKVTAGVDVGATGV